MAVRLPDHAHCENCGDPIRFGETFCSEECRTETARTEAKDKKMEYIFYAVAGILGIVSIISYYLLAA